jgi:hypothetical protein
MVEPYVGTAAPTRRLHLRRSLSLVHRILLSSLSFLYRNP